MPPALRVVLDTNVLLSGLAYPGSLPGKIITAWQHGSVEVVLSTFIIEELRRYVAEMTCPCWGPCWPPCTPEISIT